MPRNEMILDEDDDEALEQFAEMARKKVLEVISEAAQAAKLDDAMAILFFDFNELNPSDAQAATAHRRLATLLSHALVEVIAKLPTAQELMRPLS